jgi:hypothetical protein
MVVQQTGAGRSAAPGVSDAGSFFVSAPLAGVPMIN